MEDNANGEMLNESIIAKYQDIEIYGKKMKVLADERRAKKLAEKGTSLQPHLVEVLQKMCHHLEYDFFIDVGANYGEFAAGLLPQLPKQVLLEPHPVLANLLRSNFARDKGVHVVEAALSDFSGRALLNCREGYLGASSLGVSYVESLDGSKWGMGPSIERFEVRVEKLDDIVEKLGSGAHCLYKIDVEGWEKHVLSGASKSLSPSRPWTLLLEFSPAALESLRPYGAVELWRSLASHGGIILGPQSDVSKLELSAAMYGQLPVEEPMQNCDVLLFSPFYS